MRRISALVILHSCLLAVGCGGPAPEKAYPVTGTVTLDGKPLSSGVIFLRAPLEGYAREVPIKDGNFRGQVKEGKFGVEICSYREVRAISMPGMPPEMTKENVLNRRYNTESTLTAEIKPDGPNELTFELSSE